MLDLTYLNCVFQEYLETVAERQTQLAIEENLSDNMRLANSEVRDTSSPPIQCNDK